MGRWNSWNHSLFQQTPKHHPFQYGQFTLLPLNNTHYSCNKEKSTVGNKSSRTRFGTFICQGFHKIETDSQFLKRFLTGCAIFTKILIILKQFVPSSKKQNQPPKNNLGFLYFMGLTGQIMQVAKKKKQTQAEILVHPNYP